MFITKMGTRIPQDSIDYGNSRKVTCGGDHYFSSDSWAGSFTTEGDQTWTSKLYGCGDVGVSTSRKSRFIRSWSSSSRLCRSTCQPEGQRVTRLRMHRARLPSELSQGGRGFNAESDETMPCVELPWTQQVDLRPFKES